MHTVTIFSRINSATKTKGNVYCSLTGYQQNFCQKKAYGSNNYNDFILLRIKLKFLQAGFLKLTPAQARAAANPRSTRAKQTELKCLPQ